MRSAEPTTELKERLFAKVAERTLLRVTERNRRDVERAAEERAAALGVSLAEWVARLDAPGAGGELEYLVRELTVGETYLFRGPVFAVLRDLILPELIPGGKRRDVACCACAAPAARRARRPTRSASPRSRLCGTRTPGRSACWAWT